MSVPDETNFPDCACEMRLEACNLDNPYCPRFHDATARVLADELEAHVMEIGAPSDAAPSIYDILIATAPRRTKRARKQPAPAQTEQLSLEVNG